MPTKFLLVLTPYEEQALLQLAAKYEISPLYALRLSLLKTLHSHGLIHQKIYEALMCKLLERPAPHPFELKILHNLQNYTSHNDLPMELGHYLSRAEDKFLNVLRNLKDGKLTKEEVDFWLKESERYQFLEAVKRIRQEIEKFASLIFEAPTTMSQNVDNRVGESGEQRVDSSRTQEPDKPVDRASEPAKILIYPTMKEDEELKKQVLLKIARAIKQNTITYETVKRGGEDYARIELTLELELLVARTFKKVEVKSGKTYFWVPLKTLSEYLEQVAAEASEC